MYEVDLLSHFLRKRLELMQIHNNHYLDMIDEIQSILLMLVAGYDLDFGDGIIIGQFLIIEQIHEE